MKHGEMAKHTQNAEGDLYVVCDTGTEEKVCQQCEKLIDGAVLERCFIPRFQKKKRFLGEWHMQN